jgi:hypothetical protein
MSAAELVLVGLAGAIVGAAVFWLGYFSGNRAAMQEAAMYFDDRRNEFLYFKRDSIWIRDRHGNP